MDAHRSSPPTGAAPVTPPSRSSPIAISGRSRAGSGAMLPNGTPPSTPLNSSLSRSLPATVYVGSPVRGLSSPAIVPSPPRVPFMPTGPPQLDFTEEGSFPHTTLKDRMPKILSQAIDAVHQALGGALETMDPEQVTANRKTLGTLALLRYEMQTNKKIRTLQDTDVDVEAWNPPLAEQDGRLWYSVPWLLAECYMYRRLREALLGGGEFMSQLDPFATQKRDAFVASQPAVVAMVRHVLAHESENIFATLLLYSLWANRADLSLFTNVDQATSNQIDSEASLHERDAFLLCNQTTRIAEYIDRLNGTVAMVLDNAGLELVADLAMAYWLTRSGHARKVVLHAKRIPWFVSDVLRTDIEWTLDRLAEVEDCAPLATACRAYLADQTWEIVEDPFWTLPNDYSTLPTQAPALHTSLGIGNCSLTILKGDLNSRKLLGDRAWEPDTPLATAAAAWPSPLVIVRTLKSPVVAGLTTDEAARAAKEEESWNTSGNYGVIQTNLDYFEFIQSV